MIDRDICIEYNWPNRNGEIETHKKIKLNPGQVKRLTSLFCEFGILQEKYANNGHLNIGANTDGNAIAGAANYKIIVDRRTE